MLSSDFSDLHIVFRFFWSSVFVFLSISIRWVSHPGLIAAERERPTGAKPKRRKRGDRSILRHKRVPQ